jgi:DNA-binding MltR family transcriptional regulator
MELLILSIIVIAAGAFLRYECLRKGSVKVFRKTKEKVKDIVDPILYWITK